MQTSCSEDFLMPEPLSSFTPENTYTDPSGYESVLVTLRKTLVDGCLGSFNYMLSEWVASEGGTPCYGSQQDWHTTTPHYSARYKFLSFYTELYVNIKNANSVIGRIDDIEWDNEQEKNRILAEAYWHRSYWYYWLVNTSGDVPFIQEEVKDAKLDYYTHSRWAVLDKLQRDLESTVQYLPEEAIPGAITKSAGNHLLAKIYLADLEFDKAIEAATSVIDDGNHALMTQRFGSGADNPELNLMWDIHRPENKNITQNAETILAVVDRWDGPAGAKVAGGTWTMGNWNASIWYGGVVRDSQGGKGTTIANDDPDEQSAIIGRGQGPFTMTTYLPYDIWNNFEETWQNTPDLRRADANWLDINEMVYNNPSSADFGKPIDMQYVTPQQDSTWTSFPSIMYKVYFPQEEWTASSYGGDGDWYIYRLAETFLLRAEAYFWKGDLGKAAIDINMIRERAGAVAITAGNVDIDFIFDERARELMLEEPRHAELVRASYILAKRNERGYSLELFSDNNWFYDRLMQHNVYYTTQIFGWGGIYSSISPFHVLWPVPSSVITANTLGRINQNNGYDGAQNNIPPLEEIL